MKIFENNYAHAQLPRSYRILIDTLPFRFKYTHWVDGNDYYMVPCSDIREWLANEMPERFDVIQSWITFDTKEDAITFKLRWAE